MTTDQTPTEAAQATSYPNNKRRSEMSLREKVRAVEALGADKYMEIPL